MSMASIGNSFARSEVLHDLAELSALRDNATASKAAAAAHKKAVQAFAQKHQGLAYRLARRYSRHNIPDQELRQTAMVGLLEAIARWEPGKVASAGTFATFAAFRIRHELQELIRKQLPLVRCSELVHKDQHTIRKARAAAQGKLLDEPQLATRTGLSERRVKAALETDTRDLGYRDLTMGTVAPNADPALFEELHLDALDARTGRVETTFAELADELRPRRKLRAGLRPQPTRPAGEFNKGVTGTA